MPPTCPAHPITPHSTFRNGLSGVSTAGGLQGWPSDGDMGWDSAGAMGPGRDGDTVLGRRRPCQRETATFPRLRSPPAPDLSPSPYPQARGQLVAGFPSLQVATGKR